MEPLRDPVGNGPLIRLWDICDMYLAVLSSHIMTYHNISLYHTTINKMNQNDVHGDRLAVLTTLPRCSASPEVAPASWSARRCSQGAPSGIPQSVDNETGRLQLSD